MRYMLLIYSSEEANAQRDPAESQAIFMGHKAVVEGTMQTGIFRAAEPLHPTATATTVRRRDGKPIVTDGPFAETKEQLAGYYILDCKDLDEAFLVIHHDLDDDTQLLGEQLREHRTPLHGQRDVEPAMAGKGHFHQRGKQSTVGAVVIREQ